MEVESLGAERTFRAEVMNWFYLAQCSAWCLKKCGFAANSHKNPNVCLLLEDLLAFTLVWHQSEMDCLPYLAWVHCPPTCGHYSLNIKFLLLFTTYLHYITWPSHAHVEHVK